MQGGVQAVAFYWELPIPGDEPFPRQGAYPLKKGVKVSGKEVSQRQQYPFPGADIQVEPHQIGVRPGAQHPAVFRPDLGQLQPAELVGADPLQPKEGGDGKL